MKTIVFFTLFFFSSICKSQNVLGPSVITCGGSAGYCFDRGLETNIWGGWVNVGLDRKKSITPLLGLGILSWRTPGINGLYLVSNTQAHVGVITKSGFVGYIGFTVDNKHHSIGLGFYSGYQQFRIEYVETLKTISFGCGYVLK